MHMSIGGITLSTSLVTLFNAVVLGVLIAKKIKMDYKTLFVNLLKMSAAGILSLVICVFAAIFYDRFVVLPKYVFELVKIFGIGLICFPIYIKLNLLMKMEYAEELIGRLKGKFNAKK